MNRRRYLAALGVATGVTGCLSGSGDRDDDTSDAETATTTGTSGPDGFETLDRDGTAVPLVPIDVAYDWYQNDTARFADARGESSYRAAHIDGAVLSTVQTPLASDPVGEWPTSQRIVTYCGCPHHLSSMRAATLIEAGYEAVYALDEGFGEWYRREYPMAGEEIDTRPQARIVRGRTASADAGGDAWAWHDPTGQREAAPIAADGSYELRLHFRDVDDASTIRVETPSYTVEGPLGDLTSGRVTPDSRY